MHDLEFIKPIESILTALRMVIRSADGAALSASILQFTISYTQPDHPVYTINARREAVRAIVRCMR